MTNRAAPFMLLCFIAIAACAGFRSPGGGELLAGDTGDRICGDSTLFLHSIGREVLIQESIFLNCDSIEWARTTAGSELRFSAPIDHRLVMREAVTKHRFADDSLGKTWTSQNGRLEIRRDSATYAVGDQGAHVFSYPIARDAAVMLTNAAAFDEILIRRARMAGRDSVDIPTFFVGLGGFAPIAHVRFIRPDSAQIRFGDDEIVANMLVDSVGRIQRESYQRSGGDLFTVRRGRCSK